MASQDSFNLWNTDWMDAQKRYWDAWSAMAAVAPGNTMPGAFAPQASNPFSAGLENWWKAMSASAPEQTREHWERVVGQGKGFFQFGEAMLSTLKMASETAQAGEDWRAQLERQFEALKAMYTQSTAGAAGAWGDFGSFAQMPLDTWQRMTSAMSVMPGDALQGLRAAVMEQVGDKFKTEVDRFLSVPGVGYTREAQEEAQTAAKLLLEYQSVYQEYLTAHSEMGMQTLDRMMKRLVSMGEQGESVSTVRELYDLWVDVGEDVYAEFTMRPEFAELYGRMVNSLMAVKRQGREMVDELFGALNMPTREELNTLLDRHQQLRREVRKMQEASTGPVPAAPMVDALQAEIETLKAKLDEARRSVEPAAPGSASEPAETPAEAPAAAPRARRTTRRTAAAKAATEAQPEAEKPAPRRRAAKTKAKAWDVSSLMPNASAPASDEAESTASARRTSKK